MYFYSSKQFRFLKLKKRLMPKLCNQQQQNLVFLRKKWRELSKQVWRKMSTEWWESLILMKSSRNHKISLKIQNRRIRKSRENNSLKKSPYNIRGMLQRVMVIHVKEEIQLQGLALTLLKQTFINGCVCLIHFQNQIFLLQSFIDFFFVIIVLVGDCSSSKLY